ncbi:MAG: PKD domain-containing protein [Methanoregulaceae archaeon]
MFLKFIAVFLVAITILPFANAGNVTGILVDTSQNLTINPIGNHTTEDIVIINGTTTLAVSNGTLLLSIVPSNLNPAGVGSHFTSDVSIQPGENGINTWSCNATPSLWTTFNLRTSVPGANPGEYIVRIESKFEDADAASFFTLSPGTTSSPETIQNSTPVQASFGYGYATSPEAGPVTVQFIGTSLNSPISWVWSFGDGNTSTGQSPSHTYPHPGIYTVTLTVTNAGGSNTTSEVIQIPAETNVTPIAGTTRETLSNATEEGGFSGIITPTPARQATSFSPAIPIMAMGIVAAIGYFRRSW